MFRAGPAEFDESGVERLPSTVEPNHGIDRGNPSLLGNRFVAFDEILALPFCHVWRGQFWIGRGGDKLDRLVVREQSEVSVRVVHRRVHHPLPIVFEARRPIALAQFPPFVPVTVFRPRREDDLFEEASRLLVAHQQGSISLLQRRLKVGYARAARLVDMMEEAGIVGPFTGSKAREILVPNVEELEKKFALKERAPLGGSPPF